MRLIPVSVMHCTLNKGRVGTEYVPTLRDTGAYKCTKCRYVKGEMNECPVDIRSYRTTGHGGPGRNQATGMYRSTGLSNARNVDM